MKDKNLKDFPQLVRHLLAKMVWPDIQNKPDDGKWRDYSREFLHEDSNAILVLTMTYRIDNTMLQLKKLNIEHKEIPINVDELLAKHPALDIRQ